MAEKMKKQRIEIWLILLVVLFLKSVIQFFSEGGDESPVALTLFYLIIILALILACLYLDKIDEKCLLVQTTLDKYFKNKKY